MEFLRAVTLFSDLSPEEMAKIEALAKPDFYQQGETLFEEGDDGQYFYMIETGMVKLVRHAGDKERILTLLFAGDNFGELSLIDGEKRSATAITLEDSQFQIINRLQFLDLLAENPMIAFKVMSQLCHRLRNMLQRVDDFMSIGAGNRLLRSIMSLASEHGDDVAGEICLNLHMSVDELGKMNGMSEKLTHTSLNQLENRGLIRIEGQIICVKTEAINELLKGS